MEQKTEIGKLIDELREGNEVDIQSGGSVTITPINLPVANSFCSLEGMDEKCDIENLKNAETSLTKEPEVENEPIKETKDVKEMKKRRKKKVQ